MYRYDDCRTNNCLFIDDGVVGVVPDIDVAYEGLYIVIVFYFVLRLYCLYLMSLLNTHTETSIGNMFKALLHHNSKT